MVAGDVIVDLAGYRERILKMVNSRTNQYLQQCTVKKLTRLFQSAKYPGNLTGVFYHTYA